MKINNMISRQMNKSGGEVKIVKVPKSKRLTAKSLIKLEQEISAQVNANEAMSNRSVVLASRSYLK